MKLAKIVSNARDVIAFIFLGIVLVVIISNYRQQSMRVPSKVVPSSGSSPYPASEPTDEKQVASDIEEAIPYPVIVETKTEFSKALITLEYVESTPGEFFQVTATPYPTFTPFPSPTFDFKPTMTPLSLPEPIIRDREIYYLSNMDDKQVTLTTFSVDAHLRQSGERQTRLVDNFSSTRPFSTSWLYYPSFDGRSMLLKSQELGGPTLWLNSDLARIDRIYKNIEPGGEVFNWYPDNRKFLIRAEIGGDALWLVDVSTGEYTVLAVPGLGRVEGAAASPDGLWIIYSIYRGQKLGGEIWLVDHTGRNANLLTATQGLAKNFSWSPDGKKVVYFESGLNILDVGTKMISNYVIAGHPGENQIFWSPASDRIMFVSRSHILLVGLNGEERSVSFDNLKDYRSPVWSPDGSKIIFIAEGPDRVLNIYVFDLEFDVLEILIENIDPEAHFIIIK